MKVLVVSSIPWSESNRGIDVLSQALAEEGHEVTHLVFPIYSKSKRTISSPSKIVKQLFASSTFLPYDDDSMFWFPKVAMKLIHNSHLESVKSIDFSQYDLIVLESGKPVFLIDLIPSDVKLIYRQSDPIWMLMRSNYLRELENKVIERSDLILIVRKFFIDYIAKSYWPKTSVWINGFNVQSFNEKINPYCSKRKKAVYVGFTRIDYRTLNFISIQHPDVEFHIIGNHCLSSFEIKKLSQKDNIFIHGYMKPSEYLPYVKNADFAIIPYRKDIKGLNYIGLTSKYLLFMYFKLPIISYRPGVIEEFNGLPILFAKDIFEFSDIIRKVKRMGKIDYNLNFDYYSYNGRKRELLKILTENGFLVGF